MVADSSQIIEASTSLVGALLGLVGFVVVATGLTTWFLWRKAQRQALPTLKDVLFPSREPWNTFPVRPGSLHSADFQHPSGPHA